MSRIETGQAIEARVRLVDDGVVCLIRDKDGNEKPVDVTTAGRFKPTLRGAQPAVSNHLWLAGYEPASRWTETAYDEDGNPIERLRVFRYNPQRPAIVEIRSAE